MRTLKFIVNKQLIEKDPDCDFSGLVPGTSKYLQAKFTFSEEWNGCRKAVVFRNLINKEFPVPLINDTCVIPAEVLVNKKFRLYVVGAKDNGYYITTNKAEVKQNG